MTPRILQSCRSIALEVYVSHQMSIPQRRFVIMLNITGCTACRGCKGDEAPTCLLFPLLSHWKAPNSILTLTACHLHLSPGLEKPPNSSSRIPPLSTFNQSTTEHKMRSSHDVNQIAKTKGKAPQSTGNKFQTCLAPKFCMT